ncbi:MULTISPECIES: response regulator transcription factor [Nocardia]|uniref:response regulator transcription factor n=1 Tax=Nocardia TaxID=1817 RepID=UPI00045CBFCF|nr:LuxR family transcriptional regulator [Nocardia brasiliensis]GAJ82207.1 putative two-component response regulator [Nocardia brasiliensis NBRC 14402]SUB53817.1 ATP-dependent transcriptional regulator [Nocardia brasiliensis]
MIAATSHSLPLSIVRPHPLFPAAPAVPAHHWPDAALSAREREVLVTWVLCDSKTDVAQRLYLSLGTVNTHITRIRAKYAAVGRTANTKAALVVRALQDGLIDLDEL